MLVFLLPLILFYEFASFARPERVIAFDVLRHFFELFGQVGMWTPGLAVIAILLATHAVSGEPWKVHWRGVAKMYPESLLLALPLLLLNWTVPLTATVGGAAALLDHIALGIGAGIYEELVFRLILISVILIIGADLFRCDRNKVAIFAVAASSLLFAAHHHRPIGADPFDPVRFVFRTVSGAYLAAIFWFRGYALAAGCHAAYNVSLAIIGALAFSNPPAHQYPSSAHSGAVKTTLPATMVCDTRTLARRSGGMVSGSSLRMTKSANPCQQSLSSDASISALFLP